MWAILPTKLGKMESFIKEKQRKNNEVDFYAGKKVKTSS